MSRISLPDVASATGAVAEAYALTRKAKGGALPKSASRAHERSDRGSAIGLSCTALLSYEDR